MTENEKPTTGGERFSRVLKDPRFRRSARKESKIKIDDRFKEIFSDPKFTRPYQFDKYGRTLKTKGAAKKEMEKFYRLEDEDINDRGLIEHVDSESIETDASFEDDYSEGSESAGSDSDESNSEGSDSEGSDMEGIDTSAYAFDDSFAQHPLVNTNVQIGDATRRLAIVNVDWDQLKGVDLFVLVNAFKPPMGLVKSVKIYPSEFGKERIAKEAIEGPPKEIFATENTRNEIFSENSNSEDSDIDDPLKDLKKAKTLVEESGNFDQNALRRYQLERLRYYYAVVECDSVETAAAIYHHCDGREFETSTNTLDLRYIPDNVEFCEEDISDIATNIPKKYTAKPAMVTDALQRSNVKLTWDQDDPDRRRLTRVSNHGKIDYEEADLRAYLASDSEEEIKEETQFKGMNAKEEKIARYRALLLSQEGVNDVFGRKSHDENDRLDITFTSALAEINETDGEKEELEFTENDEENEINEASDNELIQRVAVFDENGNLVKNVNETGAFDDSENKKKKKNFFSKKDDKNEKFILQKEWAKKGKGSKNNEAGVNINISKTKKMHKKQSDLLGPSAENSSFQVNLQDDRFKAVYNSPDYAIDPTAHMFKKTKGMEAIIEERQKRNRIGDIEMNEVFDAISKEECDILLHAGTGKGKTLSYLLPLAQQMYEGDEALKVALVQPNALLKIQVSNVLERLAPDFMANFKICTPRQLKEVCGLNKINVCVFDEADLSLSPACLPPKMKISEYLRMERMGIVGEENRTKNRNMRFIYSGATFPFDQSSRSIRSQILKYNNQTLIMEEDSVKEISSRVSIEKGNEQFIRIKEDSDKLVKLRELLIEIRSMKNDVGKKIMIFVRNKFEIDTVFKGLKDLFPCNERADLIVTTDSMSRGIDIDSLQHVIHHTPPMSAIDYVHRIGRLNRLNSIMSRESCKSFCMISDKDLETGPVYLKYLMESRLGPTLPDTKTTDISRLFSRNRSINKQIRRGKL